MRLGVEVLLEQRRDLIRGKRVGLITNPTGVDRGFGSIIERFRSDPEANLVALYGPEHGVRGNAQAGEYVPFHFDEQLQLPVFSLYGQSQKPPADMLTNIDAYMRSYDTRPTGKAVERDMLQAIDVLVFDLRRRDRLVQETLDRARDREHVRRHELQRHEAMLDLIHKSSGGKAVWRSAGSPDSSDRLQ